jgi:Na+/proline symporter
MSDIGLDWGPFDIAAIALIIGSPGLVIGAVLGAVLWRRHRLVGALLGAFAGLVLWLAGFAWWKMSPWG